MNRLPTFADWARDEGCVDSYVAQLDTPALEEMAIEALELLASQLSQAARDKVVSAISCTSFKSRAASADPSAHEAIRDLFLSEARMLETAARHYRDILNERKG